MQEQHNGKQGLKRGQGNNKTKKLVGWSDLSSFVHWGLINVRRKPENPESDSWGQDGLGGPGQWCDCSEGCASPIRGGKNDSISELNSGIHYLCCMI